MNEPVKFPEMRSRTPPVEILPPPPSAFVQRIPAFATTDSSVKSRRFERKRLLLWFGIAVALHAALLVGIWLMPTLRIKWEPSPDAWVHVTSLPSPAAVPLLVPAPEPAAAPAMRGSSAPAPGGSR